MLIFNHFSPNLPSFTGFQRFSFVFHTFFTWVTKLYRFWAHWTTSDQIGSSFTEFYRVLPSFTEFDHVSPRVPWVLLSFLGFTKAQFPQKLHQIVRFDRFFNAKKTFPIVFATSIFVQRRDPSPSRTAFFFN